MITQNEKEAIIELIKQQVVPAIGCTEPMAVALCVARATEILGARPERIALRLSANMIKNGHGRRYSRYGDDWAADSGGTRCACRKTGAWAGSVA